MTYYKRHYKEFTSFCSVRQNEPMRNHTSFKVGGPADLFVQPFSVKELSQIVMKAKEHDIPVTIMGKGTNILVRDNGIRGLVICLSKMTSPLKIEKKNAQFSIITAFAGTSLTRLCKSAMDNHFGGLAFGAGIPGTVGGAVKMNAGTNTGCIADVLYTMEILDENGKLRTLHRNELTFSHRKLKFNSPVKDPESVIIIKASFILENKSNASIDKEWQILLEKRKRTQPQGIPSAGCFFRNPNSTLSAGALIDQAGLKNTRIGDAMVSDKHANFILNLGNATADEIILLADIVKNNVYKHFNVNLTEEVNIKGE